MRLSIILFILIFSGCSLTVTSTKVTLKKNNGVELKMETLQEQKAETTQEKKDILKNGEDDGV